MAHHHDATDHFALTVQLGDTAPHVRPQTHRPDVANKNRRAAPAANGDHLDVFNRFYIAAAAHHIFRAAHFDRAAADVVVAHANRIHDSLHRQAIGSQLIGI